MEIYNTNALSALKHMDSETVDCVVTSPPYWGLRDYGLEKIIWGGLQQCEHKWANGFCEICGAWKGQLGLEPTFDLYIKHLCDIFCEVRRVLKKTGTCWVNMGDTYSQSGGAGNQYCGSKNKVDGFKKYKGHNVKQLGPKSLCLIPQRFAIEMIQKGWILRNTIIWRKPNCMPSSAKDRFTIDFEYLYFFVKNKKYYFEQQFEPYSPNSDMEYRKILRLGKFYRTGNNNPYKNNTPLAGDRKITPLTPGKNKRCVWNINTKPFKGAHFAVFPQELIETPIRAGCPENGVVLDPFMGTGTTGIVTLKQGKTFIGVEPNEEYVDMAYERLEEICK